jgi:hypothetical protein
MLLISFVQTFLPFPYGVSFFLNGPYNVAVVVIPPTLPEGGKKTENVRDDVRMSAAAGAGERSTIEYIPIKVNKTGSV